MKQPDYISSVLLNDFDACIPAGRGSSIAHHGEIFQGVYVTREGRLQRALVSLTSGVFKSEATFYPNTSGALCVEPGWKSKAARAAELTLHYCNVGRSGGRLVIENNIPPSWGLGSSTSDVTASIRAVAAAFGHPLSSHEVARLAVKAEVASDPVMFSERAVLFAQRRGVVLEEFSRQMPQLEVLGFNMDPTGYDTLGAPPARYSWWEIEAFRPLIGMLRQAIETQDVGLVGRVASASARINQRHLPKPHFERLERMTTQVGAVGLQVAHSGTVVGLLFNPADANLYEQMAEAREYLAEIGINTTWRLSSGTDDCPAQGFETFDREGILPALPAPEAALLTPELTSVPG